MPATDDPQPEPQAGPVTELDPRYSDPGTRATDWALARAQLATAPIYWLTTVRPDGRPHVTPLMAVWHGDALYFATGPAERKARNLESNPHVVLTTGCNALDEGLDVVVEGSAVRVRDDGRLLPLARAWEEKYGGDWHYEVRDGAFQHGPGEAWVFEVAPGTAFGFAKGPYAQTRYRFPRG